MRGGIEGKAKEEEIRQILKIKGKLVTGDIVSMSDTNRCTIVEESEELVEEVLKDLETLLEDGWICVIDASVHFII